MKKTMSIVLALALMLTINTTALADESNLETVADVPNAEIAENDIMSLVEVDISDLTQGNNTTLDSAQSLTVETLDEGAQLNDSGSLKMMRGATQSWTGTLANEGEFTYVLATLAPTQIITASLKCPQNENLNYDLFVYTVSASGALESLVAASTYETHLNFLPDGSYATADEGAAYINNTSTTNDYAIIVSATKGGSTADTFKLTVSLDVAGNYDAAEPNDSAYKAYAVSLGSIVSGATLNVVNDQDWFVMNVPKSYYNAEVYATSGYRAEVYTADGNKMVLKRRILGSDKYDLLPGVYFIRVYADEAGFVPKAYSLTTTAPVYSTEETIEISEVIPAYTPGKPHRISVPSRCRFDVEVDNGNQLAFLVCHTDDLFAPSEIEAELTGSPAQVTTPYVFIPLPGNYAYVKFYNSTGSAVSINARVSSRSLL